MVVVNIAESAVHVGERFSLSFQRTLRVPDDGRDYPLPPGLGPLPVLDATPYLDQLAGALTPPAAIIPLRSREAMWLAFRGASWKPNAVKVGVGTINAVTGQPLDARLHDDLQDYLVCPGQPWLDGIVVGPGRVRQFVAVPHGAGYSVEAQLTGGEATGGIQVIVFEPKPGRFPDEPPNRPRASGQPLAAAQGETALGAGGSVHQRIHPDPYGIDAWDQDSAAWIRVVLLDGDRYREVTGRAPPPTPVDARTYTKHGLPWFELYDEPDGAIEGSDRLASVRSIRDLAVERSHADLSDDETFDIDPAQVRPLHEGS